MPQNHRLYRRLQRAAKIEAAVNSVLWADEVLVADSNSTDNTVALAEALGARVVQVPFHGFRRSAQPHAGALRQRVDLQPRLR